MSVGAVDTEHSPEAARLSSRVAGIAVILAGVALLGWAAVVTLRAFTDAWVAPIYLSPDNDSVIQLRLNLNRQVAELNQAEAEIKRIDGDIGAVSAAIDRLSALKGHTRRSLTWQAGAGLDEARAVATTLEHLREQRAVLERLHSRQVTLTNKAREDLQAGLIDRTTADKEEQSLDTLNVSLLDNQKEIDEATWKQQHLATDLTAYRQGLNGPGTKGLKPEVAEGQEHQARLELEIIKLEAELRGLQNIRRAAGESVAKQRDLLNEIKTRPLYRAMSQGTEVAFVPYTQLSGVAEHNAILRCWGGLFGCHPVGVVAEVLPGEVVTQDPWGSLARGQYAVLKLDERDAIREKVLRIRRM